MRPVKIVTMGKSGVGKTSLLIRMIKGVYFTGESTIGASFFSLEKVVKDASLADGELTPQIIKMNFWDTAGQERYNSLLPLYTRGVNMAMICSDYPDPENFKYYINLAQRDSPDCLVILVMTKVDTVNFVGDCPRSKMDKFAGDNGYLISYTSALTGEGVGELVEVIAERFVAYTKQERESIIMVHQPVQMHVTKCKC